MNIGGISLDEPIRALIRGINAEYHRISRIH